MNAVCERLVCPSACPSACPSCGGSTVLPFVYELVILGALAAAVYLAHLLSSEQCFENVNCSGVENDDCSGVKNDDCSSVKNDNNCSSEECSSSEESESCGCGGDTESESEPDSTANHFAQYLMEDDGFELSRRSNAAILKDIGKLEKAGKKILARKKKEKLAAALVADAADRARRLASAKKKLAAYMKGGQDGSTSPSSPPAIATPVSTPTEKELMEKHVAYMQSKGDALTAVESLQLKIHILERSSHTATAESPAAESPAAESPAAASDVSAAPSTCQVC